MIAFLKIEYTDLYCWLSDQFDYFLQLKFDSSILVQYSMMIGGFISITIPIALGLVSTNTSEYKDKEISKSFLKEFTYWCQLYFVLPIIFFSIAILALKIQTGWPIYLLMTADFLSFTVFVLFIRKVQQYATNFEDYYSEKLKKEVNQIIHGKAKK